MADKGTAVRIRLYRQGLGDCHLVTVLEDGLPAFRMLIDCGVYQTVKGGAALMREIVTDVIAETGGFIDVLAVTHEHWDHVSGFNQADALFSKAGEPRSTDRLSVGAVWMGWTEDPDDPVARRIVADRAEGVRRVAAARAAANGLAAAGAPGARPLADGLSGVLGFFGGAGRTTADALKRAKSLVARPRYLRPGGEPIDLTPAVRAYVLGPPLDPARLHLLLDDDETYHAAPTGRTHAAFAQAVDALASAIGVEPEGQPFDPSQRVAAPFLAGAATIGEGIAAGPVGDFLRDAYWGADETGADQSWRRIDGDWLGASREFALKLDNATNNTSLVLVLEIKATGRTLVFAADAQVGSWLSWMELAFQVDGREVTGPDLLSRAAFLKVGHHGSHNATLRAKGLETMGTDLVAFIPTDEAVAKKVGWGSMPLPSLVAALERHTVGRTIRADRDFILAADAPDHLARFAASLRTTERYFEIVVA